MSRFDGSAWTDFEGGPWEDLFSGPWSDYVSTFWVQDDSGGFVYIIVALPPVEVDPNSNEIQALPGDPIDYRITHFDSTTWGNLESGQWELPEAFSTDPDWRIRAIATSTDDLYVSDLGGLKRIDHLTGDVTTLDVDAGLASDDIRDIVVGPHNTILDRDRRRNLPIHAQPQRLILLSVRGWAEATGHVAPRTPTPAG